MAGRDPAHRVAEQHVPVGGAEGRRVIDRQFKLSGSRFGVHEFDAEPHRRERIDQIADDGMGRVVRRGHREIRPVDWRPFTADLAHEVELRLERGPDLQAVRSRRGDGAPQTSARAMFPRRVCRSDEITEQGRGARTVRQMGERLGVGHEPGFARGRDSACREHDVSHDGQRLLRDAEADAVAQDGLEPVERNRFCSNEIGVIAVGDPNERDTRGAGAFHQRFHGHKFAERPAIPPRAHPRARTARCLM